MTGVTRKITLKCGQEPFVCDHIYPLNPLTHQVLAASSPKFSFVCHGQRDRGIDLLNVMKTDGGCVKVW